MNGWLGLLNYYMKAKRLHGVHSPFVYNFQEKVLLDTTEFAEYNRIEQLVQKCKQNQETITFEDFGAKPGKVNKTVSQLASRSGISKKYGRLLFRMTRWFQPKNILELGTSLGFASAYLISGAGSEAKLLTMEGADEIAALAQKNLGDLGLRDRCGIVVGPIDSNLDRVLATHDSFDFIYMDANHRLAPTLRYFDAIIQKASENAIVIVDDIHWSSEMREAWRILCEHEKVAISVELDRMGMLFFRTGIAKEHFYLSF